MGRIHQLEAHVVNQIAAGEVVERPASVVKELVENALDAGARRVEVSVRDGGRDLIEVADDGWGMAADDLGRAFLPHATSKIQGVEDLRHVDSLGFRGEALASIGSVARASIVSRPAGGASGHRIEDLEGALGTVVPAAASPGTVVRVEHLFARVPARRKFLRTAGTELGHIRALMGRFALAFPHVGFVLRQGGQTLLEAPPGEARAQRIARVHGVDVAERLLETRAEEGAFSLEAWIGPPSLTRVDTKLEQVYLNGRFVRDKTVSHAVREAYRDLLPPGGRRPVAFLFLACEPGAVDVNVHPGKAEVRWQEPSAVHRLVRGALRRRLETAAPGIPVAPGGTRPAALAQAAEHAFVHGTGRAAGAPFVFRTPGAAEGVREAPARGAPSSGADAIAAPGPGATAGGLRPLAQALGTYLVLEARGAIVLVDQHALHERVLFDRINDRLRTVGNLEVQRLLVPAVVHLDAAHVALLTESVELLRTLGWIVEAFGEDAVAVRGVPAVLRRPDPEAALDELVRLLERGGREGLDRTQLLSEAVDRLACRAAVMAGDRLHEDEALALLEQAEALNHAHSCPHGRPTRLTLTRADLERWFHRTA